MLLLFGAGRPWGTPCPSQVPSACVLVGTDVPAACRAGACWPVYWPSGGGTHLSCRCSSAIRSAVSGAPSARICSCRAEMALASLFRLPVTDFSAVCRHTGSVSPLGSTHADAASGAGCSLIRAAHVVLGAKRAHLPQLRQQKTRHPFLNVR